MMFGTIVNSDQTVLEAAPFFKTLKDRGRGRRAPIDAAYT